MSMMFPKQKARKKRKKHKRSILHDKESRTCYLCALWGDFREKEVLHEHHIFGGSNRRISEEEGLKVYLCPEHHMTGDAAVHRNKDVMDYLHMIGQQAYEREHSRELFMRKFGRNYLEVRQGENQECDVGRIWHIRK